MKVLIKQLENNVIYNPFTFTPLSISSHKDHPFIPDDVFNDILNDKLLKIEYCNIYFCFDFDFYLVKLGSNFDCDTYQKRFSKTQIIKLCEFFLINNCEIQGELDFDVRLEIRRIKLERITKCLKKS